MTTTKTIKIEIDEEMVMAKVKARIGEILKAERERLASGLEFLVPDCRSGVLSLDAGTVARVADWIRKDDR